MNYYNENDPFAAAWLRELIKAGHIAPGDVDERSIEDVRPTEIIGYTQCHFFAGIGGWPYALRLAGWPDTRSAWTGSCPCQPFSTAGKRSGTSDERHLWPSFFHLIEQCKPSVVFGEQVEAAIRQGWLDLVQDDMEGIGYAFAAAGIPAACVGAPHLRARLYFVADSSRELNDRRGKAGATRRDEHSDGRVAGNLAESDINERRQECTDTSRSGEGSLTEGLEQRPLHSGVRNFWSNCDWLYCRDEKYRPVESGTFPLAHGIPNRVGKLRGYGNAIVAPLAQAFIESYLETEDLC